MPGGSPFPEERLCKAAWDMWLVNERSLKAFDEQLLTALTREDQKVLRLVDGQRFEFRHDQMRAYLVARWATEHEVQPISLFEQQTPIWRLSRKEQEGVWHFFAELLAAKPCRLSDATALWKWSTGHPDRVILQHALQRALKEIGLDPEMSATV